MLTRRLFLGAAAAMSARPGRSTPRAGSKPAILGGTPVRQKKFPSWPVIGKNDERGLLDALRSLGWYRRDGKRVAEFEAAWAEKLGVRHAIATNGGTTALWAALQAHEVGPGDEVIVPPYTFVATVNVVLLQHALPVFVDTDPKTFQIDARKIDAAITPRTRAIMPVHLGGAAADMDAILEAARKHDLPVIEDACQSHLGEWRSRKLGSLSAAGCFSFQGSKNLNCGEGGVLATDDGEIAGRASAFHSNGAVMHGSSAGRGLHGCNLRMTEFQGALLLSQMERLEEQMKRREENAAYLGKMLAEVPGIEPARTHEGCTRNAYHLYMFRYGKEAFDGLPRKRFLEALKAEGVPASSGYGPLNKQPFLENAFASRAFKRIYSDSDIRDWRERNRTPENDRLTEEGAWMGQSQLLGPREDMEQIAEAMAKIQKHASELHA